MSGLSEAVDYNDLGRGPLIMGLTWTFAGLAILAVMLRFYVRTKLGNGIILEDWLMLAAMACNVVSQSFVTTSYHYGLGKHDAVLAPDQMISTLKWMWLANTPGLLVGVLARISIAILLIRLFGVHFWLKLFLIIITGLCTVLTIVMLPCTYLQSTPVSGNWNPMIEAKRWNPQIYISLAFFIQALWTFSDLTFVLLPVMVIWRLQLALHQRIGLVLLMSVSLFTMALSILKTIGLQQIADQQSDPTATDVQYDASLEILWSCLEQACVIIMGCVPSIRAVVKLEITKSISSSVVSILRRRKMSKASSNDVKDNRINGQYDSLEMATEHPGQIDGHFGPTFSAAGNYDKARTGSEQHLVENGILSTTEAYVSYHQT